jgi:hypothetical protein
VAGCDSVTVAAGDLFVMGHRVAADMARWPGSGAPGGGPGVTGGYCDAFAGVWAGNQLARRSAVAVVGLSAIGQMFVIPACPSWSLLIIAADVVALRGLCGRGNREDPGAA